MGNYIFLGLVLLSFFGLGKLFVKAGIAQWNAYIPIYNFYKLSKLLNKPWWWSLIMIVPGVNILMYGVYGFNVARAFNKPSNNDLIFATLLPYVFFVKLGYDDTAKFVGLEKFKIEPSTFVKNWLDPIIFAVIAASIIRGYFIEAFTIPTSSLEKSLMVGDFLFVNKFAYGPKIPQTPLSFPFAHHTLPVANTKSYLEWIKLPYFRLPGFGKVENNDIVVFNYPDGDSVLINMQDLSYYNAVRIIGNWYRNDAKGTPDSTKSENYFNGLAWNYLQNPDNVNPLNGQKVGKIVGRPVDKREHYVKRCVAIAGDKLEIKDGDVYINGSKQKMPEKAQHYYYVKTTNHLFGEPIKFDNGRTSISNLKLLDEFDIYATEVDIAADSKDTTIYKLNMPASVAEQIKKLEGVVSVTKKVDKAGERELTVFPHNPSYAWNNDNFGPLLIPKAGLTIPIDTHNICLYDKVLNTYDDGIHQVAVSGGQVLYDGKPITQYTFKQDYYFMMGDNRHNSADSRSWGLVPFDHIVGSPFFVWLSVKYEENNPVSGASFTKSLFKNSKEGKYRWDRFLCYVDDGTLHSIKIPFIVSVAAIWGLTRWNRKRKEKQEKVKS